MAKQKTTIVVWAEYTLARLLLAALRWLPRPAAELVARSATRLLDRIVPKLRRVARINLAFAFPELSYAARERVIDGVFGSIARMLLALARFPALTTGNIGEWIEYEGLQHYHEAKQAGNGILIATAHLGNWELSAFAHALLSEPMHVMVRPLDNPLIDGIVTRLRTHSGNSLIGKRDAARTVLRTLKQNDAVGILIDQNTAPSEGIFINFFGRQACAGTAFVKLAQHSGAAVVPGFALWDESRKKHILRFYESIPLTGDLARDTQRIHSFIESVIRAHPDQWMWIHRRWKIRPPGEPPLY